MANFLLSPDIEVRRGNGGPVVTWALEGDDGTPLPLGGRSFALTIVWRDGSLPKDSEAGSGFVVDPATSRVTWIPTLLESQTIPPGRRARYELELRDAQSRVAIVSGSVTGVGGLNDPTRMVEGEDGEANLVIVSLGPKLIRVRVEGLPNAGTIPPEPDPTFGALDFSDPASSGLLAAFLLAQPATPSTGSGSLDFSDPNSSGLLAALMLAAA